MTTSGRNLRLEMLIDYILFIKASGNLLIVAINNKPMTKMYILTCWTDSLSLNLSQASTDKLNCKIKT